MSTNKNRVMRAIENFSTNTFGPIKETKPRSLSASHGPSKKGKSVQRPKGVKGWYQWFNVDGAVYSAITSLSEQAAGIGFETIMPGDDPHTGAGEKTTPELDLVNEFNAYWNLDALLPNITRNTLIAGYCPVETRIKSFPSKCAIKIIHPKTVKEVTEGLKFYHGVDKILQEVNGVEVPISGKWLSWFDNNPIANNKLGSSVIPPIEGLLGTKHATIDVIDKILIKRLAPRIIWKSQRDISLLKEVVEDAEPEEDIFLEELTVDEMKDIAQIVEVNPDSKYWEYIEYIDRLIYKSLYAGDLDYWRNATQASANILLQLVDRNIRGIRRTIKRGVEMGFWKPLIEANDMTKVPRLIWNEEQAKIDEIQLERIIQTGIKVGFIQMPQYYAFLNQAGIDLPIPDKQGEPRDDGVRDDDDGETDG